MEETGNIENKKKILIVEDDQFLHDLVVKKFMNEGYDVKSCVNANGVFRELSQEKPDIILLDLILPEVDGFEILEKIKADDNYSSIPVLILTNHGQKEDQDRVLALGAEGLLVKANFTLDEIIEKVHRILTGQSID